MTDFRQNLKKRIKGAYGQWLLANLPSGRWAAIWHACLDDPQMPALILGEVDWFHDGADGRDPNPSHATRREALDYIILRIRRQIDRENLISGGNAEVLREGLEKAARARRRHK